MELKKQIINISKDIDIDIIGFAKSERLDRISEVLKKRKDKGYEVEFEESNILLRIDPTMLMSGCKTIIAIGISYNIEYQIPAPKEIKWRGFLSKSSWGEDYHKILRNKLKILAERIKEIVDFNYTICVDTSPLIDREIAKKAGIGWYGKNCSIINDEYGSFIFIGYLLTDLELYGDKVVDEKCGDCNLCIKACPVGAIQDGYIINSRRCISYLTQTKERIPYELRTKMGTKIYGCDTCQLVCPKNRAVKKGNTIEFKPEKTKGLVDIEELLNISNKEFKKKYGSMSGAWRGKNVLKRNAIIALANIGDENFIGLLKKALKDESPMIREYAAWAIIKINKEEGLKLVENNLINEKNNEVYEEIKKLIYIHKQESKKSC